MKSSGKAILAAGATLFVAGVGFALVRRAVRSAATIPTVPGAPPIDLSPLVPMAPRAAAAAATIADSAAKVASDARYGQLADAAAAAAATLPATPEEWARFGQDQAAQQHAATVAAQIANRAAARAELDNPGQTQLRKD